MRLSFSDAFHVFDEDELKLFALDADWHGVDPVLCAQKGEEYARALRNLDSMDLEVK
jgi:hypothetical protein